MARPVDRVSGLGVGQLFDVVCNRRKRLNTYEQVNLLDVVMTVWKPLTQYVSWNIFLLEPSDHGDVFVFSDSSALLCFGTAGDWLFLFYNAWCP